MKQHEMEELEGRTDHAKNRVKRKRCKVSKKCIKCTQGTYSLEANNTTFYCKTCKNQAHAYLVQNMEGFNEEPCLVTLCGEIRTFDARKKHSNEAEQIQASCWAIHHSDRYYPIYPCCGREKVLIVPMKPNPLVTRINATRNPN